MGTSGPVVRVRVTARGRVQGVFYRDSCRREAQRLGVAGWVRNLRDGGVEAVFEGEPAAVTAMVEWSGRGPAGAQVDSVSTREEDAEGLHGFRVTR